MLILQLAGFLFLCHLAFSSVSVQAKSVRRSSDELYGRSDNDAHAPLVQQDATANPRPHPTTPPSRSRLSTEIIIRHYIISADVPPDRVAESNRVFNPKGPVDYLIAPERGAALVVPSTSTSSCPTTGVLPTSTMGVQVPCNLVVQCRSTSPASTKARDIVIVVAVFLLLCLVGIVFLVRNIRRKTTNAGDAESTSKQDSDRDLIITPYLVPPSASNTTLPTCQGNLGQVTSSELQRPSGGGRTKLISVQPPPVVTPSATRPTVEGDSQLSNAGQHIQQQQRELGNRLRAVQQEMAILQANLANAQTRRIDHVTRGYGSAGDDSESGAAMREVRELIRELESQIACLQEQHGLVVDPPPGYQPSPIA